jgi:hypothetical protein
MGLQSFAEIVARGRPETETWKKVFASKILQYVNNIKTTYFFLNIFKRNSS